MSERLRYPELAPEGISTLRATEHYLNATTALPAVLLELVRLRVSLVNRCSFCTGHHTQELRKHNEPQSRIEALEDWSSSSAFTPRERAALQWADSVTDLAGRHAAPSDYAAVSSYFRGKDLVDLTLAIASANTWNRMSIAFGAEWDPSRRRQHPSTPASEPAAEHPNAADRQYPGPAKEESSSTAPPSPGTASSPSEVKPAHEDAPPQDVVDDDGGKVAHN